MAGGTIFGYDNTGPKGQRTRCINEAEAAVVRSIYERFATGEGLRTIALALNRSGALSPRAQQGRPNGWSASSVREVLHRPLYRGEVVFGKTMSVHDLRAMRKVYPRTTREQGRFHSQRTRGFVPRRGRTGYGLSMPTSPLVWMPAAMTA